MALEGDCRPGTPHQGSLLALHQFPLATPEEHPQCSDFHLGPGQRPSIIEPPGRSRCCRALLYRYHTISQHFLKYTSQTST